ncbi:hypothetical protein FOLKNPGA_01649 [Legionella sp. PC1000]|nr:hypothetical protein FOLKNPGA_01649 [Legionella sp. PC1000]
MLDLTIPTYKFYFILDYLSYLIFTKYLIFIVILRMERAELIFLRLILQKGKCSYNDT